MTDVNNKQAKLLIMYRGILGSDCKRDSLLNQNTEERDK
jgi:hypothetical protein